MAWPPPVLAINRTNAIAQQDTHPADHNALALAMNDTTTRLQSLINTVAAGDAANAAAISSGDAALNTRVDNLTAASLRKGAGTVSVAGNPPGSLKLIPTGITASGKQFLAVQLYSLNWPTELNVYRPLATDHVSVTSGTFVFGCFPTAAMTDVYWTIIWAEV